MRLFKLVLFSLILIATSITATAHVDSMRVYMPFYGTMNDWSGWNNNGQNPNPIFTHDRNMNGNRAMLFDGSNTHITVSTKLIERETFTYSLWMQLTERPDSNGMVLLQKGEPGCSQTLSVFPGNGDSVYLDFKISLIGGDSVIRFPAEIPNLAWNHIGLIKSKDSVYLYFNMIFNTEKFIPGTVCLQGDSLRFAAALDGSRPFKGRLDELRVYVENIPGSELFGVYGGEKLSLDLAQDQRLSVYPNPAKNHLEIQSTKDIFTSKIYSIQGSLVHLSNTENKLDLSGLENGVYSLEIEFSDGTRQREKLIIRR